MVKIIIIAIILCLMNFAPVQSCTTLLVTKGASEDGASDGLTPKPDFLNL